MFSRKLINIWIQLKKKKSFHNAFDNVLDHVKNDFQKMQLWS